MAWESTPVFLPGGPMDRGAEWPTVHRVSHTELHLTEATQRVWASEATQFVMSSMLISEEIYGPDLGLRDVPIFFFWFFLLLFPFYFLLALFKLTN